MQIRLDVCFTMLLTDRQTNNDDYIILLGGGKIATAVQKDCRLSTRDLSVVQKDYAFACCSGVFGPAERGRGTSRRSVHSG